MTTGSAPEPKRVREGVYRIRWEVSPDPVTGRRRQRSKTVRGDLADAKRALADEMLRAGRDAGIADAGKLLLRDYWAAEYSRDIERLAPKTVEGYRRTWESTVCPLFGHLDMRSASRRAIRRMLLDVQPVGRQQHAYKLLRQMFNAAYMDEMIDANPMMGGMRLDKVHTTEKPIFTAEELPGVLKAVEGEFVEPFVIVSLLAGTRREEVCALKWEDFAFDRTEDGQALAYIRVERTAQRIGGRVVIGRTKTDKSTRTVLVVGAPAERLEELSEGKGWLNRTKNGRCANPDIVSQQWKRLCRKKGVKHVTFTGMRASYSTIQAQLGTPDTVVSLMMGHSQLTTRYRHYLGANVAAQLEAGSRIAESASG